MVPQKRGRHFKHAYARLAFPDTSALDMPKSLLPQQIRKHVLLMLLASLIGLCLK